MEINIIINPSSNQVVRIDFNSIRNNAITDDECIEYQEVFGKIVTSDSDTYSYLLSDLLNREDGTTHFLDQIVKYKACIETLNESVDNLVIYNIETSVLISIKNYCLSKGIKVQYSSWKVFLNGTLNLALFSARILRTSVRNSLLVCYAKVKLGNKIHHSVKKVFISYFDYRSISQGKFIDPFFSPLQKHLQEINSPFAVVNILMFGSFRQAIKYINEIKATGNPNIITLFNLIPLFGVVATFFKLFKLRPKLRQEVFFLENNISDLVRENLKQEFLTIRLQHTLERIYVVKLLEYKQIDIIYYPFENFAWEKVLCLENHTSDNVVKLIGFQHTSFSLKLHHHFPSPYETSQHIFPSRILTTGEIPKNMLDKYGFYPDNVLQIGCALRHQYVFDIISDFEYSNNITNTVSFALSFDVSRYDYLVDKIISIFGGKDVKVILKYHPLNKGYQFSGRIPENIVNQTHLSWKDIMKGIDLLLYEGNSVCIDALAYNIPAIYFPFTGDLYNTNQLYNFRWDIDAGDEEETYYEKIQEILRKNLKNDNAFFNYSRRYVKNYFHPIDKDGLQRFLD